MERLIECYLFMSEEDLNDLFDVPWSYGLMRGSNELILTENISKKHLMWILKNCVKIVCINYCRICVWSSSLENPRHPEVYAAYLLL